MPLLMKFMPLPIQATITIGSNMKKGIDRVRELVVVVVLVVVL